MVKWSHTGSDENRFCAFTACSHYYSEGNRLKQKQSLLLFYSGGRQAENTNLSALESLPVFIT